MEFENINYLNLQYVNLTSSNHFSKNQELMPAFKNSKFENLNSIEFKFSGSRFINAFSVTQF